MYKIAICDDNLFFIKQLRTMLKEKIRSDDQIEIYEYHSGEQLLMEMDHFFDVIFMDVVLPKRDGMSIAEELYRNESINSVDLLFRYHTADNGGISGTAI